MKLTYFALFSLLCSLDHSYALENNVFDITKVPLADLQLISDIEISKQASDKPWNFELLNRVNSPLFVSLYVDNFAILKDQEVPGNGAAAIRYVAPKLRAILTPAALANLKIGIKRGSSVNFERLFSVVKKPQHNFKNVFVTYSDELGSFHLRPQNGHNSYTKSLFKKTLVTDSRIPLELNVTQANIRSENQDEPEPTLWHIDPYDNDNNDGQYGEL